MDNLRTAPLVSVTVLRTHMDEKLLKCKRESEEQISELQACVDLLLKHHEIRKPLAAGKKLAIINKAFKPTAGLSKWGKKKHKLLIQAQKIRESRRKSLLEQGWKPAADVVRTTVSPFNTVGSTIHPK